MGTLTELSALGKSTIIVPMPGTHQEENAHVFSRTGAALVFDQPNLTSAVLTATVRELLADDARRAALGTAIRALLPIGAAGRIAEDVLALARAGR
jgi:UDP-N-acetylglucosamine--N-acetylmuramyl-(pentapeptide) pyrophosphoryl-undecaprenol N-acetylglucosamine transferase